MENSRVEYDVGQQETQRQKEKSGRVNTKSDNVRLIYLMGS